jgi:hypothetical protein
VNPTPRRECIHLTANPTTTDAKTERHARCNLRIDTLRFNGPRHTRMIDPTSNDPNPPTPQSDANCNDYPTACQQAWKFRKFTTAKCLPRHENRANAKTSPRTFSTICYFISLHACIYASLLISFLIYCLCSYHHCSYLERYLPPVDGLRTAEIRLGMEAVGDALQSRRF